MSAPSLQPKLAAERVDQLQGFADGPGIVNNLRFIIQICQGIVRSSHIRRQVMFYDVLAVLVLLFLGSTLFWPWLRAHPLFFLGYFALCGWLTLLAALFAIYDLAKVRQEARAARKELNRQYFPTKDSEPPHDSHPR